MRLVLPDPGDEIDSYRNPGRWVGLPGLCCQAAGGRIESTVEISAAWMLLYTAAHVVDTVEDDDPDPLINKLGGSGAAINTANGLFLSAISQLQSMHDNDIPEDLAVNITTDYLETILVMTSGQHLDLTVPQIDLNRWWQIAEAKSGGFFSLACRAGARLGTSDMQKVKSFSEYGFNLGLMLQILDDLEDFQLLLESKESASRITLDRSLAAAYASDVLPDTTKDELKQLVRPGSSGAGELDKLIEILDDCGAGLYMVAELEKHYDLGIACLSEADPLSPAGEELESMIRGLKFN